MDAIRDFLATLPAWFVLFGTFLPVIGMFVVLAAAQIARGRVRWWLMFFGPVVVAAACWMCAPVVLEGGNLLAAVVYGLFVLAMIAYYPVLLLIAAGATARARRVTGS